jgi:hypothetical protein
MNHFTNHKPDSVIRRFHEIPFFLAVIALMMTVSVSGCGDGNQNTDDALTDGVMTDNIATDSTADTDATTPVAQNVIHVDLTDLPESETAFLHVAGKHYQLKRHDNASREAHRTANPALLTIKDTDLTHYAENVETPDDKVALMWVTHTTGDRDGQHGLGLVGIHIPQKSLLKARTIRARQGWPRYARYLPASELPDNSGETGVVQGAATAANTQDPSELIQPIDIAKSILFHHPELTSLDPDVAAMVMTHIENTNGLVELAESISSQGMAYEHDDDYPDGWAVLVPILDEDGNRRVKADGSPFYNYQFSDQTVADAEMAIKNVLRAAHNDPALKGTTFHTQDGAGAVDASATPIMARTARSADMYSWTLDHTQTRHGLEAQVAGLDNNPDNGLRRLKVSLKNHWLRHLTFFVAFEDVNGNRIPIPATMATTHDDKTNNILFVGHLSPVVTIMGIPLSADWTDFTIDVPNEAVKIDLMSGGLGTGHLEFGHVASNGIILTATFEYAVPLFFLVAGAGLQSTDWYKSIMADSELVFAIAAVGGFLLAGENAAEIAVTGNAKGVLARTGSMIGGMILSAGLKKLKTYLIEKLTAAEMEDSIPFVGWGIQVLNIASTLASMAETTIEVLSSPWIINNSVTPSMDMQITIHHATDHLVFPETATHYKLIATYTDSSHRELPMKAMSGTTVSDPIVETFYGVPAGGTVEVSVAFYSDNGWLAGSGSTGRIANIIASGNTVMKADITIQENKVPLSATTVYTHKQSINYVSGKYKWVAGTAPTETITNLSCANVGSHLCALDNITFSENTGMFGYAWQASGPNMSLCDTSTTNIQLHYIQNLSWLASPDSGYKSLNCGMSTETTIIYELQGAANGSGYNFFLDTRNGQYHLRKVALDGTTPLSYSGKSWGRFTQPLDDIAIRTGGYIVGANWANSKIEILKIPDAPFDDDVAPLAQVLAGEGVLEGLLYGPAALAFTSDGVLLVLESLNKRIQALDIDGNPVKHFNNKTEYFASLHAETGTVTYLDMGVEFMGYIYVLSYTGDGSIPNDYRLDIYDPDGAFLSRTTGFAAHKMVVDLWRNVYSLNYRAIAGIGGRTEPSVSEWIPSTPTTP